MFSSWALGGRRSLAALGMMAASMAGGSLLFASALGGASSSPRIIAPPNGQGQSGAPSGQTIDGISCDSQEGQRIHIHQHLVILNRGHAVDIPANVGQPAVRRCIYWLHTHTPDGVIHIEAPKDRSFTLGDFFKIWGEPISRTRASSATAPKGTTLKVWVDGKPFTRDPRTIPLAAHTDIVIEAGPPFPKPPVFSAWGER